MQQRFLGHSGLRVSALTLGTMSWGTSTDEDQCRELLRGYISAGGTVLDTAISYGEGSSEAILGELIGDLVARADLVLVSKAGIERRQGRRMVDCSRRGLLAGLDASLARLGTDYLDLWLAHTWDPHVPLEETLDTLDYAVSSGRVRYAGVSNYSGWQLAKSAQLVDTPLVADQVEYSLLNRSAEAELVPAAEDAGSGLMCWGALGRGVLTGKYRGQIPADSRGASDRWAGYVEPYLSGKASRITEAVLTAAKGLDRDPSDVALSWLVQRPAVATAIIGPRTPEQLQAVLAGTLEALPEQIVSVLDEVSLGAGAELGLNR
ncbi:aryl-alcohol dehydrogenase-like predicted oxidoreductase [Psychromicrobium silvestre]|uniref:Aryl-alcohol dehydrogenase-like predicted oxidoreductase n=1 Tax=Psychromicrobium silvestre TaxID=1645614 RepID=A0A7Y9S5U7_9MICC|nr:aldo/keto reductase [Psychromicrobium silvestre]NYE94251.1 aryl-alcohol dehydrogenase-like predicted oxidoreductase [Psychromicrobium silvestre]